MAAVDAQRGLGLGHGVALQGLHRGGGPSGRRGDLACFVAEGPLVGENLCGVLACEHCWNTVMALASDRSFELIRVNMPFTHMLTTLAKPTFLSQVDLAIEAVHSDFACVNGGAGRICKEIQAGGRAKVIAGQRRHTAL